MHATLIDDFKMHRREGINQGLSDLGFDFHLVRIILRNEMLFLFVVCLILICLRNKFNSPIDIVEFDSYSYLYGYC